MDRAPASERGSGSGQEGQAASARALVIRILLLAAMPAGVRNEDRGSGGALIFVASVRMQQMEAMIPLWRMFKCRPEARAEQIREWTTQDEDGEVNLLELSCLT